jgi:hypothetical protein
VIVPAIDGISAFDVDQHVVFQQSNGLVMAIEGGTTQATTLTTAPPCAALASDFVNVYCRWNRPMDSFVYSWSITGASGPSAVHLLPRGYDLAIDGPSFYYSNDPGGLAGQAVVESVPRNGNGGPPPRTQLMLGQTSPRSMVVGPSHLFWIDVRGFGSSTAAYGPKVTFDPAETSFTGRDDRFIAADPVLDAYWVGVVVAGGVGSIVRVLPGSSSTMTLRSGLTGLGGIAVDATFVYWTQSDGRVYRAFKAGPEP